MGDKKIRLVRFYDPAIVRENSQDACVQYARDLDISKLSVPADAIVFVTKPLSRSERRLVRSQPNDPGQYEMALRLGLVAVENLSGRSVELGRPAPGSPLTDEALDGLGLGEADEQEIGRAIKELSFLGRGVPVSLQLLDSSLHAFSAVVVRLAGAKSEESTPTGDA